MTVAGSCHCGALTVDVPCLTAFLTHCQCSICRKLGVLWAYFPDAAVTVAGATQTYVCNRRVIAFHRCPVCGCTAFWRTLGEDFGRMGINARLFDHVDLGAIEVRVVPGPSG